MEPHDIDVGKSIKDMRVKSGMGIKEFASKCSISETSLRAYENGITRPRRTTLDKIERGLRDQLY